MTARYLLFSHTILLDGLCVLWVFPLFCQHSQKAPKFKISTMLTKFTGDCCGGFLRPIQINSIHDGWIDDSNCTVCACHEEPCDKQTCGNRIPNVRSYPDKFDFKPRASEINCPVEYQQFWYNYACDDFMNTEDCLYDWEQCCPEKDHHYQTITGWCDDCVCKKSNSVPFYAESYGSLFMPVDHKTTSRKQQTSRLWVHTLFSHSPNANWTVYMSQRLVRFNKEFFGVPEPGSNLTNVVNNGTHDITLGWSNKTWVAWLNKTASGRYMNPSDEIIQTYNMTPKWGTKIY